MSMTNDTLDLIKTAHQDINKAGYSQATGLINYDLQAPAKLLYPVFTPLRNSIPRTGADGGTATNWRQITAINSLNVMAGVTEGQRGGAVTPTLTSKTAAYKSIGLESFTTFEADLAAYNFDDAKARAVEGSLQGLFIQEERMLLGGNASLDLGTTPTPTVAVVGTGGTLAATVNVICVALTNNGRMSSSVVAGVQTNYTRTNVDATTDTVSGFHGAKSVAATATISSGTTNSVTAYVTPVVGAAAYAWYWGAAGSELLGAITTINSTVITAAAAGTQNASAITVNSSTNALDFDGILTQVLTSGSGAYVQALPTGTAGTGTVLTSDGAGGITQIETAFAGFWDNYKLSPEKMYVSAATLLSMNKIIIANGGAPLIRYMGDFQGSSTIEAGSVVGSYLNKITNKAVKVEVHPDMPNGMILFYSQNMPAQYYPYTNVGSVLEVKCRRDYYQIEWPLRTRKYEYGVYSDELLACYFPPAFGLIYNIAA